MEMKCTPDASLESGEQGHTKGENGEYDEGRENQGSEKGEDKGRERLGDTKGENRKKGHINY
jgi:hypothetical protein